MSAKSKAQKIVYFDHKVGSSLARQNVIDFLSENGLVVQRVGNAPEAIESIVNEDPQVFVHVWEAGIESEAIKLHRKLGSSVEYAGMVRLVLVNPIVPKHLAMTSDYGFDRVLLSTIHEDELLEIIHSSFTEKQEDALVESIFGKSNSADDYNQNSLDKRILAAFKKHPSNRRVSLEYASYLARSGDLDTAEKLCRELVGRNSKDVRSMNLLGRIYMKQKRFNRALEVLKKADILSPNNPDRLVLVGDAYFGNGEHPQAKAQYEQALELDPDVPSAHNGLGNVYVFMGDVENAMRSFKKCLSEDELTSVFNNAAVLAVKSNRTSEGLKLYETALKTLQTETYAHLILYNIGLAFYRMGELEQATEAL